MYYFMNNMQSICVDLFLMLYIELLERYKRKGTTITMLSYPYTIIYTRNRNAYIKISKEGKLVFMIPQRYKADVALRSQLFEKAETMRKRYQTRPKVEKWNEDGILLFGEWVLWEEFW
jgi:hypothetical protein